MRKKITFLLLLTLIVFNLNLPTALARSSAIDEPLEASTLAGGIDPQFRNQLDNIYNFATSRTTIYAIIFIFVLLAIFAAYLFFILIVFVVSR